MKEKIAYQGPEAVYGALFEAVQLGGVFDDSKTFTDCRPKQAPTKIMAAYNAEQSKADFSLNDFVTAHFDLPLDLASGFKSDTSKSLEAHIQSLWPILKRSPDQADPFGTLLPLPSPYIVPGGRFGEIYYWDSYFTMLGLKAAGEVELIRNMIDNFAYFIDELGYIPNGNRTYFLGRSQPPFFCLMIELLAEIDATNGRTNTLKHYLPQLDAEYRFWMDGAQMLSEKNTAHRRVVLMDNDTFLNRNFDDNPIPRQESFKEDIETAHASDIPNGPLYQHIRAACESGWDFSSRWNTFDDLNHINATDILPVDLNCLLYKLECLLAKANQECGDAELVKFFQNAAQKRKIALQSLFFNKKINAFGDYNFVKNKQSDIISAAAMYPLFLNVHTKNQGDLTCQTIREQLLKPGGIVTTNNHTAQQWDAPNGWAPMQWVAYIGAKNAGQNELAMDIKNRWLSLVEKVFKSTGKMLEKYNVEDLSLEAGGGEYPVQDGFGWTNGVSLAF